MVMPALKARLCSLTEDTKMPPSCPVLMFMPSGSALFSTCTVRISPTVGRAYELDTLSGSELHIPGGRAAKSGDIRNGDTGLARSDDTFSNELVEILLIEELLEGTLGLDGIRIRSGYAGWLGRR